MEFSETSIVEHGWVRHTAVPTTDDIGELEVEGTSHKAILGEESFAILCCFSLLLSGGAGDMGAIHGSDGIGKIQIELRIIFDKSAVEQRGQKDREKLAEVSESNNNH